MPDVPPTPTPRRRSPRGLSLAEMLVSLAISALLLTATAVALKACFKAYADASRQFSTQAASRMITTRLMTLMRTSTAHGPLQADPGHDPPVTLSGHTITSPFMEMVDSRNRLLRIEWKPASQELWMTVSDLNGDNAQSQPLIGGVTDGRFYCIRKKNSRGLWTLQRGTMDLTILPGGDSTFDNGGNPANSLGLENGVIDPLRVVGSTKPRKID